MASRLRPQYGDEGRTGARSSRGSKFDGITVSGQMFNAPVGWTGLIQVYNQGVQFESFLYRGSSYELL